MNGAESLVRTMVKGGVDVCFTNPGTSEMHFVARGELFGERASRHGRQQRDGGNRRGKKPDHCLPQQKIDSTKGQRPYLRAFRKPRAREDIILHRRYQIGNHAH